MGQIPAVNKLGPISFLQTSTEHVLVVDQFELESLHFIDSVHFCHVATENIYNASHRLKYMFFNLKHPAHVVLQLSFFSFLEISS